ncbi:MAG: hypothetical protein MUO31_02255 [Thermodesulfovibrionales bacterium]|nr:hypothetical protein [Thermodesulfovibrionales bacterium]
MKIKCRISGNILAIGGIILSIGAGLLSLEPVFGLKWIFLPIGTIVFLLGVIIVFFGCFEFVSGPEIKDNWDDNLLRKALETAPPKSTVSILQTWLPDKEKFCPFMEELLIDGSKQFHFRVLLMYGSKKKVNDDLLSARIRLRAESHDDAFQEIVGTIKRLNQMKQKVDTSWVTKYMGAKLDIQIRSYKFMPFGPIYQIGNQMMLIGFYLNSESSVHGPMLIIRNPKSRIWKKFEDNINNGWNSSTEVKEGSNCF